MGWGINAQMCQARLATSKIIPRSKFNENCHRIALAIKWLFSKVNSSDSSDAATNAASNYFFSIKKRLINSKDYNDFTSPEVSEILTNGYIYVLVSEQLFVVDLCELSVSANECFESVLSFLINRGANFSASSFNISSLTSAPLDQNSHCVLIEAMMQLDMRVNVTCDRIPSLRRGDVVHDLACLLDWEDVETVLLSWINATAKHVNDYLILSSTVNGETSDFDCEDKDKQHSINTQEIACIEDVYQDLSDGQSLLSLLAFYCPHSIPVEVIRLKKSMGFSDCLHNLSIVHNFCKSQLGDPWILGIEELVYPSYTLKVHVINALLLLHLALKSIPNEQTLLTTMGELRLSNNYSTAPPPNDDNNNANVQSSRLLSSSPLQSKSINLTESSRASQSNTYRSPSMNFSHYRESDLNTSQDPAGDALLQLETRWRQNQRQQFSSHVNRSYSPQVTNCPSTVPDEQMPAQGNNYTSGGRKTPRSLREPSVDSAIGTLSTNSEASFSSRKRVVPLKVEQLDQKVSPSCSFTSQNEIDEKASRNYGTYSRGNNERPPSQRMSLYNITGNSPTNYETEIRPLSAMKNNSYGDFNSTQNRTRNFSKISSRVAAMNERSHGSVRKDDHVRSIMRPKSAMGERMFLHRNSYSDDSEEPNSEPDPLSPDSSEMTSLGIADQSQFSSSNAKLSAIKFKMEERRKSIQMERARLEAQRNKQRQKLGQTAFMRVMKRDKTEAGADESDSVTSQLPSDEELNWSNNNGGYSMQPEMKRRAAPNDNSHHDRYFDRRQRAKSTNLEAMYMDLQQNNYGGESARQTPSSHYQQQHYQFMNDRHQTDTNNFDANSNTYNADKQLIMPRKFSKPNHNTDKSAFLPLSLQFRDDLESFNSGMSSAQSSLRRTKAFSRPLSTYASPLEVDDYNHHQQQQQLMKQHSSSGNSTMNRTLMKNNSAVDLNRNESFDRDLLIEQNQILARELESLKHKFTVELETRKLQNEREQLEMQRKQQFEIEQQQALNNYMINSQPNQTHSLPRQPTPVQQQQQQYWNMSPHQVQPNRLPTLVHQQMQQQQQQFNQPLQPQPQNQPNSFNNPNNTYMYNNPISQGYYPNPSNSAVPYNSSPVPPNQRQAPQTQTLPRKSTPVNPYYPYHQLQPPYAVHDQELYHNFETTHKQEYNFETLNASHHNYYQHPFDAPPSTSNSTIIGQPAHQNNAPDPDVLSFQIDNQHKHNNENVDVTSSTNVNNNPTSQTEPHRNSTQTNRPKTLPVSHNPATATGTKADNEISPIDPNVDVGSSVEVTPENENSPAERAKFSPAAQSEEKEQRNNQDSKQNSSKDEVIRKETGSSTNARFTPHDETWSNNTGNNESQDNRSQSRKGEAFSVNFMSDGGSAKTFIGSADALKHRKVSQKRRNEPTSSSNSKGSDYGSRPTDTSSNKSTPNSSSKSVDNALRIIRDQGSGDDLKENNVPNRRGGVALVIDVEALDEDEAEVKKTKTDEEKRKEKEQEFLKKQAEKIQRDLEKRKKLTEAANQESQQRQLKEMEAQEQKKREAAARRERIMEQYLQKKREKEMEEAGIPYTPPPKGSVGGGGGLMFVAAGGSKNASAQKSAPKAAPKPKPRSKSTTSDVNKQSLRSKVGANDAANAGGGGLKPYSGNISRSRRGSENLLSDVESVVSGGDNWDSKSEYSEYNGPKLFVKPSSKSNKQKIQNAITQSVFPGAVNNEMKQKILKEIDSYSGVGVNAEGAPTVALDSGKHFLILFRDHSMKYRAIYLCEGDCSDGDITKVIGTGPNSVKLSMIQDLYKYDSGGKRFLQIPSKTMSVSVDAFTIHNQLWKKK